MSRARFLSNTSGFTILEVLIALAIFSIGLMAVGALQARSLMETGNVARKAEAWAALEQQVGLLKETPFYSDTAYTVFPADLVDNGGWHTNNYLDNRYTVHWQVTDDFPIGQQDESVIAGVATGNYTVCKTIVAVVTRAGGDPDDLNQTLGQVEFIKTWAATGMP